MARLVPLLLTLLVAGPAVAQSAAAASSRLFVERAMPGRAPGVRLVPAPERLRRGQSVIVLVVYRVENGAPRTTVVNSVPPSLRFERADGRAELSVDGGRRYGRLTSLTVGDEARRAVPADVTHIRWQVAPSARPPVLSFRSTVR